MTGFDWSLGSYEQIAAQQLPVARIAVDQADPRPTERVLDIGCGTGSAALLAAERHAQVTGVDPSARLVESAAAQAEARGLDATFLVGTAEALPIKDAVADVIVSVFGVVFTADAGAAAAEIGRVASPGGRAILTAWLPEGALAEMMQLQGAAVGPAVGRSESWSRFAWHEQGALSELFSRYGFTVSTSAEVIAFRARSAEEFLEEQLRNHPLWLATAAMLEPRGEMEPLRRAALDVLRAGNEDHDAFCVSSRYVVAALWR